MDELMTKGEQIYNTACAACHQVNGEGLPNVFPGMKGSAIVLGDIAAHIDIVLNGKAGTAMQAFGPQLNDADLAAVITYERNAWGNNTGDVVQPGDIAKPGGITPAIWCNRLTLNRLDNNRILRGNYERCN